MVSPPSSSNPGNSRSATPPPSRDDLSWLEDLQGARATDWVRKNNERTQRQLENDVRFSDFYDTALSIATDKNQIPATRGVLHQGWVYDLWQGDTHPRGVWQRATLASLRTGQPEWQELLDIDALSSAEGQEWSLLISAASFSADGRRCLVGLRPGGTDKFELREFDLGTRSFPADGFRLPAARTNVLWQDDDTLIVATTLGSAGQFANNMPTDIRLWRRSTPFSSAREVVDSRVDAAAGETTTPMALTDVTGERLLTLLKYDSSLLNGELYEVPRDADARPRLLTKIPLASSMALYHGELFIVSLNDWQIGTQSWKGGSLLSISLRQQSPEVPAVRLIRAPGPRESISRVQATKDGLLVFGSSNVRGRVLVLARVGSDWQSRTVGLPDYGVVDPVLTEANGEVAFATYQSFLAPPTLYEIGVATGSAKPIVRPLAQFHSSYFVTEQLEATSHDGTRVPYFVVRPRDLQYDGRSPTLLHGYGGHGQSQLPRYSGVLGRLWLDHGGVYVVANIRGGGEFGPAWWEAALKSKRQNAYDDFIAVAEDLIRRNITSPRHLGIHGLSNGGLLMGVMMTQRPELFHAVVAQVPVLDMIRYFDMVRAPAVREFGSLAVPEERAFLEKISPMQHLRSGRKFPLPLLMTSTSDPVVHPAQARRFAARMDQLGLPYLYFESAEGGHSMASTPQQRATIDALVYTYLAQQLM